MNHKDVDRLAQQLKTNIETLESSSAMIEEIGKEFAKNATREELLEFDRLKDELKIEELMAQNNKGVAEVIEKYADFRRRFRD